MAKLHKLKMIIGGASGAGKTSFLLGKSANKTEFNQLGVSFKPIECLANEEDSFKFVAWDLKFKEQFRFMYPIFCRGSSSAILVFDVSNRKSFEELPYWIKIFRENQKNRAIKPPIVLVGMKTDLKNQVILKKDVNKLVDNFDIDGVFYTSIVDSKKKEKKNEIFKCLIEKIEPFYKIHEFELHIPEEDGRFWDFVNFFAFCPLCGGRNHGENLKAFFYSREPDIVEFRERLLNLMNESKYFDEIYYNKIRVGIPCCSCFKKVFN
jgi:GTPase SAR1 family protein